MIRLNWLNTTEMKFGSDPMKYMFSKLDIYVKYMKHMFSELEFQYMWDPVQTLRNSVLRRTFSNWNYSLTFQDHTVKIGMLEEQCVLIIYVGFVRMERNANFHSRYFISSETRCPLLFCSFLEKMASEITTFSFMLNTVWDGLGNLVPFV